MTRVVDECRPPRLVNVAALPCEVKTSSVATTLLILSFSIEEYLGL